MHGYRVVPIDPAFAAEVRQTGLAPGYGHPAHAELATGYGPCRLCLDTFAAGEERRILVTYDPFVGREPYPLPSPIYIHERACEPYAETARFPDALHFIPLTLNGYARGRQLLGQMRIAGDELEAAVDRLFGDPRVDYIHVRNTEAGCFIAHLDRAQERAQDATQR